MAFMDVDQSVELIYYTHNRIDKKILKWVQEQLLKANLPIISVSLEPIDFGRNIVVDRQPSIITMYTQILTGLRTSKADSVFCVEHDVLYHPTHFYFRPPESEVYYFNTNVWRWDYPKDRLITYDHLVSLSGLCANRKFLMAYYEKKFELIKQNGWEDGRNPRWARVLGHEPGKSRRRGGFADERVEEYRSLYPNIDIRHSRCLTPAKVTLNSFVHLPTGWQEATIDEVLGWNLKELK